MSSRIVHIAANTFREAVRDRVLYNLIAFALLLSGAAILFHRHWIGLERNRKAYALHCALTPGTPLGVHRGQVFRISGHALC